MKKNFASVAAMLALATTTALTTVPAFAQVAAPPPTPIYEPANNNYAPVPDGYYGTPMTSQGINAVAAGGPRTAVLSYARKGFSEAPLPDGERIGIEFNLDPNGWAYFARAYDLNNPADIEAYNENLNAEIQLNEERQAMYEAGRWTGPAFYFGRYNPCWGRDRGFEVIIGVGGREVIFADPYRFQVGFPVIIEPIFGFGFGRGFDRFERERRIEFERERFHERFRTFYGNRFPGREFPRFEGRREFPGGREGRRDFPGIPQHDPRYPQGGQHTEHQQREVRPVPTINPGAHNGGQQQHGDQGQRGGGRDGGRQVGAPGHHHG